MSGYTPAGSSLSSSPFPYIVFCPRCRRAVIRSHAFAVRMQQQECTVCSDELGVSLMYEACPDNASALPLRASLHILNGL